VILPIILIISLIVAAVVGLGVSRFVKVIDHRAAARITQAEQARQSQGRIEERVGGAMERLVPKYVRQIQSDLYWAAFMDGHWKNRTTASVLGRQVLLTGALGFAAYLALGSPIALVGGLFIGWSLGRSDLRTKAETARLRIAQELPEFVQLMAAESASGAALETVIRRAANGTGFCAAWFRAVFETASGRALFSKDGENGLLHTAAERSGHSGLISLAIQLGFVGRGVQVQSLLKSLAQTFSDEFIAQAETRAEKLGSSLGVMSAIFYFMPFVITVLIIVGVPLISTINGG